MAARTKNAVSGRSPFSWRRFGFWSAVLILLSGLVWLGWQSGKFWQAHQQARAEAEVITRFLDSVLTQPDGGPVAMSQWRGKTLVLNYWASWCAPCREEMPVFSRLQTQWAARHVQFVGLALDTAAHVQKFAARHPVSYPLLMANPESLALAKAVGNASLALPFTVVLSADGRLQAKHTGALTAAELTRLLTPHAGPQP